MQFVPCYICPVCTTLEYSYDFFSYPNLFKGGLQAIAELLQVDCEMYGLTNDHYSVTLRRYAGMALTNLTFGDVANKVRAELYTCSNFSSQLFELQLSTQLIKISRIGY